MRHIYRVSDGRGHSDYAASSARFAVVRYALVAYGVTGAMLQGTRDGLTQWAIVGSDGRTVARVECGAVKGMPV